MNNSHYRKFNPVFGGKADIGGLGTQGGLGEGFWDGGDYKQGGWVPDILEVESKGEGCPRAFWKGVWKEAEGEFLER